ncbi:MAG: hypothetical protein AMDU4_FER2C00012G0001 [Ferroplasma sp. Type II]|nr:MAG: hypothetical protein AMDU4_FER2C00012G0001 [Ferroplasma sp. Type II]
MVYPTSITGEMFRRCGLIVAALPKIAPKPPNLMGIYIMITITATHIIASFIMAVSAGPLNPLTNVKPATRRNAIIRLTVMGSARAARTYFIPVICKAI